MRGEEFANPRQIVEPDGEIDVVVWPRDGAHVEVDRPAAEKPVVDLLAREQLVHTSERGELP